MIAAKTVLPVALSPISLASVLDQSVDCVKLVGLQGDVQYMNANGLCVMEIDDFSAVEGRQWANFWPPETQARIRAAYASAADGDVVRFRAFCPTMKGAPSWWDVTVSAVMNDQGSHAGYLAISRDATENEQGREAMHVAAKELRHRLKNTYMMISSLLAGFARGNEHHAQFAREMADRLVALGRAQALFADNDAPCDLETLIAALVSPFDNDTCHVTIDCAAGIQMSQGRADAIALVVGELAVNSSKHGAIAHGGSVAVSGRRADGHVTILWHEQSAMPVAHTQREGGQGLALIERIMRARGGSIAIDWHPAGLSVTLQFPAD